MVTAYPVSGKQKSLDICRAFVQGCDGIVEHDAKSLRDGAALFYGVDHSNEHIWREVQDKCREFYYCDNSYFDPSRGLYYRVTRSRLQHCGDGISDGKRFAKLGIAIKPWRESGAHIVVCPQSTHFLSVLAGLTYPWLDLTLKRLRPYGREILVRDWSPNKKTLAGSLLHDLAGAHVLVTHSSAAAITAVLEGVPVVTTSPDCAANPMASSMAEIEAPLTPAGRQEWAGVLADHQWTLDEFRAGVAWQMLEALPYHPV